MDMAIKDLYAHANHQNFPTLHVENSRGDPFRAASSGEYFSMCCFVNRNSFRILPIEIVSK